MIRKIHIVAIIAIFLLFAVCISQYEKSSSVPVWYSQGNNSYEPLDHVQRMEIDSEINSNDPYSINFDNTVYSSKNQTISLNFRLGKEYSPVILEIADFKLKVMEPGNYMVVVPCHMDMYARHRVNIYDLDGNYRNLIDIPVHFYEYEQECAKEGLNITEVEFAPAYMAPYEKTVAAISAYSGNTSGIVNMSHYPEGIKASFNVASQDLPVTIGLYCSDKHTSAETWIINTSGSYKDVFFSKNTSNDASIQAIIWHDEIGKSSTIVSSQNYSLTENKTYKEI